MTTFSSPLYFKQRNSTILLEINNHVTSQDLLQCFQILPRRYYSKKGNTWRGNSIIGMGIRLKRSQWKISSCNETNMELWNTLRIPVIIDLVSSMVICMLSKTEKWRHASKVSQCFFLWNDLTIDLTSTSETLFLANLNFYRVST